MTPPAGPPTIPTPLIEWLERTFPARMPALDEPERSIWLRTGQVELVKLLRHWHDRQQKPTYETTMRR